MNYIVITCLLALTASTNADGLIGSGLVYAPGHASADYYAYPRYAFEYAVRDPHTGDNKAQWEKRDGDTVRGAYSLVEPDGSVRVVEYSADDKSGFNAVVKRIGPNLHPTTVAAAPIYRAPIPVLNAGAVAPITVGPVAKLMGLANAPLMSGPILGKAVSSANIWQTMTPVISSGLANAPLISSPILGKAVSSANIWQTMTPVTPIVPSPVIPAPIIKSAPVITGPAPLYSLPTPILPSPIIKSASILNAPAPLLSTPLVKTVTTPFADPVYSAPWPVLRGPIGAPYGGLGSIIKAPLATPYMLNTLGTGLLAKSSVLPAYDGISSPLIGVKY